MPEDEPLNGNLAIGLGSAAAILGSGLAGLLALQRSAAALPWKVAAGITAGAVLLVLREGIPVRRWPGWNRFLLGGAVALILYWLATAVLVHRSLPPWIGLLALAGTVAAAIALSTPHAGGLACLLALVPAVGEALVLTPGVEWYELFSVRFAVPLGLVASLSRNYGLAAPLAGAAGFWLMAEPSWAPLPAVLLCGLIAGWFALALRGPILSVLAWASLGLLWRGLDAWKQATMPERSWEILVTVMGFLLVAAVSWWLHRQSAHPVRWIALSGLALVVLAHRLLPGQGSLDYLAGAGILLTLGFLAVRWEPWPAGDRTVFYPLAGLALLSLTCALQLSLPIPNRFLVVQAVLAVPGLIWLRRRLGRPLLGRLASALGLALFLIASVDLLLGVEPAFVSALVLLLVVATWILDGYFFGRAK